MTKAINPKIWGESGWLIIHRLSFNLKTMSEVHQLLECLKILLPCPMCRNNLTAHLKSMGIPHNMREVPEFMYKLHKRANDNIEGKQKSCITFQQVEALYKPLRGMMNEKEWIFIESVISTHKGYYKETSEFTDNLKKFLDLWVKYTDGLFTVTDTTSKLLLKEWLRKNKKKALVQFSECRL